MYTNNINAFQFIDMIKNQSNPQELVVNMLRANAKQNPVFNNIIRLIEEGNTKEIESIVRNIATERGIDFDKEFNSFKQMFRR